MEANLSWQVTCCGPIGRQGWGIRRLPQGVIYGGLGPIGSSLSCTHTFTYKASMERDIIEDIGPKPEAHQVEAVEPVITQTEKRGIQDNQLKSTFDALSIWKAAWTFRKTAVIAALAGFTAVTDGESSYWDRAKRQVINSK